MFASNALYMHLAENAESGDVWMPSKILCPGAHNVRRTPVWIHIRRGGFWIGEHTKSKNNGQEKAFDRSTKHVATGNVGFKALSFQVPRCGVSHMECSTYVGRIKSYSSTRSTYPSGSRMSKFDRRCALLCAPTQFNPTKSFNLSRNAIALR